MSIAAHTAQYSLASCKASKKSMFSREYSSRAKSSNTLRDTGEDSTCLNPFSSNDRTLCCMIRCLRFAAVHSVHTCQPGGSNACYPDDSQVGSENCLWTHSRIPVLARETGARLHPY
jgi:hypothetical protein